jgi:spore maturation protein CgeB
MKIVFFDHLGMNLWTRAGYFSNPDSRISKVPELSSFQPEGFWVKALRNQGHDVTVIRYTDSFLLEERWIAQLEYDLYQHAPLVYKIKKKFDNTLPRKYNIELQLRNRKFVSDCVEADPDAVLIVGGYNELFPETVGEIKEQTGATVVGMSGTGPFDWGQAPEREAAVKYYDYLFTTCHHHTSEWRALGVNAVMLPTSGCDPEFFEQNRIQDDEYAADVSFVGQVYPRRVRYLEELSDLDLALYGSGWSDTSLSEHHRGEAWGPDMVKAIYNSTISVNIHHRYQLGGGNLKLFEIPAAGTFQLTDAYDPEWYTEGEDIVSFDTPTELREKVEYYLENGEERTEIAKQGKQRVIEEHNYDRRMEDLVECIRQGGGVPDGVVEYRYIDEYGSTPHWTL